MIVRPPYVLGLSSEHFSSRLRAQTAHLFGLLSWSPPSLRQAQANPSDGSAHREVPSFFRRCLELVLMSAPSKTIIIIIIMLIMLLMIMLIIILVMLIIIVIIIVIIVITIIVISDSWRQTPPLYGYHYFYY